MPVKPQLVVFPGLGEGRESAQPLLALPFDVLPIEFIAPFRHELFSDYVERMAVTVRNRIDKTRPVFFCGISFGSAIAAEMTAHVACSGLILISGYRASVEISPIFQYLGRVVAPPLPVFMYRLFVPIAPIVVKWITRLGPGWRSVLTSMYRRFPKYWFREHCRMAVSWKGKAVDAPLFRIHGSKDPIIPYRDQPIDLLIDGDKHMCQMSHPELVNPAIEQFVRASAG